MQTIFSTHAVSSRDRFDYWHSVACERLIPHDSSPIARNTFNATLRGGALSDLGVFVFENEPMEVAVAPRHMRDIDPQEVLVLRQLRGELRIEQDSRVVSMQPGDFMVLDPRLPYTGNYLSSSSVLLLKVPRSLLERRVGALRMVTGLMFSPADRAEHAIASTLLEQLPQYTGRLGSAAEDLVSTQVLDLVALCLANGPTQTGVSTARSLVLIRLRAAIDAKLNDPNLDASTVAERAGVSVRYANDVLAEQSTSIMRLIQSRRLARCRAALEDPRQSHRTVSEIAFGWGFSDLTHFGRRFRDAFGAPPAEYRRRFLARS